MMKAHPAGNNPATSIAVVIAMVVFASLHAAGAAVVESVRDGRWTQPETWKGGSLPAEDDTVVIARGHSVEFDIGSSPVIPRLHVSGVLVFSRERDTELNVGVLTVGGRADLGDNGVGNVHPDMRAMPVSSRLEVGTPDDPVPAGVTARIALHFVGRMDPDDEPALVCRPGGRVDLHGAPMERTWTKLGADAEQGERVLTLSRPVQGWRVGDDVIVTGEERGGGDGGHTTEERKIVRTDGLRVELDWPLDHPHGGSGDYRCEVANLSRNVTVASATPLAVRGHTMFHKFSSGAISYTCFDHLGKEGALGRYPIHFHMVKDTMRGASVVGASVVGSGNRWVTVHGTEYMVVRDCVGYRSVGHGFFLEDGTEVYNVFDRNLAVRAAAGERLDGQVLPFDPNDGAGFWWANGRNAFVRNVACENDQYGFRYDSQKRSNFNSELAVRTPGGAREVTDIRTVPIYRFSDNEAHTEGLYGFAFAGTEGVGPDTGHPHRLRGNTAWNVHYAFRLGLPTMLVEDTTIERAAYGIYRPWFDNHVYRDLTISRTNTEPFNRGLDDRSLQHGPVTVDGITFREIRHGGVPMIQLSAHDPSGVAVSHFRDVRVENGAGGRRRALVNMGGGPRVKDVRIRGVPVVLHDYYGEGRHAKVVSSRDAAALDAPGRFREDPPLTGDESRVAEVADVGFPQLLDPVDDGPPATVVTWPVTGLPAKLGEDGTLVVRGTTTDDTGVRSVTVNGVEARDVDYNFHRWEAVLSGVGPGSTLALEASAEDLHGNKEVTPHRISVTVVPSG